jgi:hypothetical protein
MLKTIFRTWVRSNIFRKGASGQSPLWTLIGLMSALRFLRNRFSGRDAPPVFAQALRAGERFEIVHTGKPTRKLRKDRRRSEAMALSFAQDLTGGRRRKRKAATKRISGNRLEEMIGPEAIGAALRSAKSGGSSKKGKGNA